MTDRYIYHRDEFENDCIFFTVSYTHLTLPTNSLV